MDALSLVLVRETGTVFQQYLPGNFQPLVDDLRCICVGAVYQGKACGAALAEPDPTGSWYLRYIYVDPAARQQGLGTYLLRGLLGVVQSRGAEDIRAVWSAGMLENGKQIPGILERAGFSKPEPMATEFSASVETLCDVTMRLPDGMSVYDAMDLPQSAVDRYETLALDGQLPAYADVRTLRAPCGDLSSFCTVEGDLAGVLLLDRQASGLHLTGFYVLEPYRQGRAAAALIARSIRMAKERCPPGTEVWTSAINRVSYSMCAKVFRCGRRRETEFLSIYRF